MSHLIFEAQSHNEREGVICLYVDTDNERAVRFYRRWGFENVPHAVRLEHGFTFQGMAMLLTRRFPV